jgi:nucleoside-diphosphate-sugar epimerase
MDVFGAYTEVMIRWLERLARGEPPVIFGDGLQTRAFSHIVDVAPVNLPAYLRGTVAVMGQSLGVYRLFLIATAGVVVAGVLAVVERVTAGRPDGCWYVLLEFGLTTLQP